MPIYRSRSKVGHNTRSFGRKKTPTRTDFLRILIRRYSSREQLEVKVRHEKRRLVLQNVGEGLFKITDVITLHGGSNKELINYAPGSAHVYLSGNDGLQALKATKEVINYFDWLGYSSVRLLETERGSWWIRFKAYWSGEESQQVRAASKEKANEAYQYAEQWAKDAFVNRQQAEVAAVNVGNIVHLMATIDAEEEAVYHLENLLIIKYMEPGGRARKIVRQLNKLEQRALESNSGILREPKNTIADLALLVSGGSPLSAPEPASPE